MQFGVECDLIWNENKVEIIKRIHLHEKNLQGVQKRFQNDHLLINATCVGMPNWRNQKKVWNPGLIHSLQRKPNK